MKTYSNKEKRIAHADSTSSRDYTDPIWIVTQLTMILATKPFGLGGLVLKARHGPTRDKFLETIESNLDEHNIQKVHPGISEMRLDGGLDFASTLEQGRAVYSKGLFDGTSKFIKIVMGERIEPSVAARFSRQLDSGNILSLIVVDEGVSNEERTPDSLMDRIALFINLDQIHFSKVPKIQISKERIKKARRILRNTKVNEKFLTDVTNLGASLGITSLRPTIFTMKVASVLAALRGSKTLIERDVLESISLTLSHRAKFLPDIQEDNPNPEKSQQNDTENGDKNNMKEEKIPLELLVEAAKSNLPTNILEKTETGNKEPEKMQSNISGSGQKKISFLRGRPLPSRQGTPNGRNRIDIIGTLRTAAPWQQLRKQAKITGSRDFDINKKLEFRSKDIKIRRYQDSKNRLIIFSVDASGSLAVGRLAEAKGAVELLLAKAYSSRDQVALVAFRGESADTLLSPSKSLAKTKKALSSLPGGGGTPLASGLQTTLKIALDYRQKGFSPVAVILTDGKANIDLEGNKGREKALKDSAQVAKLFPANEIKSILIDTSNRTQASAEELANNLRGQYITLPRANAKQLSNVVMSKLN